MGSALCRSVMIGATDWAAKPGGIGVPQIVLAGVTPEFFFVPAHATQRIKQEGHALGAAMVQDMRAFYAASNAFVQPQKSSGPDAVAASWRRLMEGSVPPNEGLVHAW